MSEIKASHPTNYIQRGQEYVESFNKKADKGIADATSFSVFGMRVPKGPFADKDAVKRLEAAQARARQLQEIIAELFQTAFAPTSKQ